MSTLPDLLLPAFAVGGKAGEGGGRTLVVSVPRGGGFFLCVGVSTFVSEYIQATMVC